MKTARALVLLFGALLGGCSVAPAPDEAVVVPAPEGGLVAESYDGAFAELPPLDRANDVLTEAAGEARSLLSRRLGIHIDPDRPRRIAMSDELERVLVETRIRDGRLVQSILLPAAPVAQLRVDLSDLVTEGVCAAALTDPEWRNLPGWYAAGAPGWLTGSWEKDLTLRALDPGLALLGTDALLPPLDPTGGPADPVSAAVFFHFLAGEFGANRLPGLARALSGAASPEEGLRTALDTDPASLPVAFEGYRERLAGEILEDPVLREVNAATGEDPAGRVRRLSGLSGRARNRYVAAAALEALGRAQYEAGAYEDAADTFARVERDHVRHALDLDGDRFRFAMCFLRTGEPEAAALRLSTFLVEFPTSEHATAARSELAAIFVSEGRTEEAVSLYSKVATKAAENPIGRRAQLELGRLERSRMRYAAAEAHLVLALPDPEARAELSSLRSEVADGLPPAADGPVREALEALADEPGPDQEKAIGFLTGVGPVAAPIVDEYAAREGSAQSRLNLIRVAGAWPEPDAVPLLARFLDDSTADVAVAAVEALLKVGVSRGRLERLLDGHPGDVTAARAEFDRRFGGDPRILRLRPLLKSEAYEDRMEAAYRLASIPGVEATRALVRLSGDESPPVRRAAAAGLGGHSEGAASKALEAMLSDKAPTVRLEALTSLAALGRRELVRDVGPEDDDPRVRVAVASLLLKTGEEDDVRRVVGMLEDADGGVRSSVEALLRNGDAGELAPWLARALRGSESEGHAMRLVRVMSHLAGEDLGYDPGGGAEARERTAARFLELVRSR